MRRCPGEDIIRGMIGQILSWLPHRLPLPKGLSEALDCGIAITGQAMVNRHYHLKFLLDLQRRWRHLPSSVHEQALTDTRALKEQVLAERQLSDRVGVQQETLLHLLPDTFQDMLSPRRVSLGGEYSEASLAHA